MNPSGKREHREVVVVGAGLAGLSAAWNLRERDVLVLEEQNRAGGRVFSLPRDPYWLNLGAGVFSATNSPVRDLVAEMELETKAIPGSTTALAFGDRILAEGKVETYPLRLPLSLPARVSLIKAGVRIRVAVARYNRLSRPRAGETPEEAERRVDSFEGDRSFAEFLGPLHPDVDAILRATAANRIGAELETLSANGALGSFVYQWRGDKSTLNHNLVGGSGRLPEELGRRLGARLRLESKVVRVECDADRKVTVSYRHNGAEQTIECSAAVVATPADVARGIISDLPACLDAALGEVRYGPAVMVALLTDEKTAMPYDDVYAVITPRRDSTIIINVASTLRGGSPRAPGGSLLVYRGGEGARELLSASDEQVTDTLLRSLYDVYPAAERIVSETVVQRWERIVPFAYPGRHRIQSALEVSLAPIFLAGDYLGSWANMEVAVATGIRAASGTRAVLEASPLAGLVRSEVDSARSVGF